MDYSSITPEQVELYATERTKEEGYSEGEIKAIAGAIGSLLLKNHKQMPKITISEYTLVYDLEQCRNMVGSKMRTNKTYFPYIKAHFTPLGWDVDIEVERRPDGKRSLVFTKMSPQK